MSWYNLLKKGHDFDQVSRGSIIRSTVSSSSDISIHIVKLPSLFSVEKSRKESLFVAKLRQCSKLFNFLDTEIDKEEKELKSQTLTELSNFILSPGIEFSLNTYQEIIKMLSNNIFRVIDNNNCDSQRDEPELILEASWPHLHLVYLFFTNFIGSPYINAVKTMQVLKNDFISQMIDMFNSEDHRERFQLKVILYKIYAKFTPLREHIRNKINWIFLSLTYESQCFNGISELLEIFCTIIKGFSVPLKIENRQFFKKILMPMVKTSYLADYYFGWSNCVIALMEKDLTLTEQIIKDLLKYWPKTCSEKEAIFLDFLEKILTYIEYREFIRIEVKTFKQIAKCISSPHFNTAARALNLFINKNIANLIEVNYEIIMPLIIPSLYKTSKKHWNEMITTMARNVLQMMYNIDTALYRRLIKQL